MAAFVEAPEPTATRDQPWVVATIFLSVLALGWALIAFSIALFREGPPAQPGGAADNARRRHRAARVTLNLNEGSQIHPMHLVTVAPGERYTVLIRPPSPVPGPGTATSSATPRTRRHVRDGHRPRGEVTAPLGQGSRRTSSTRRFSRRPTGLSLPSGFFSSTTGRVAARPIELSRPLSIPWVAR